MRGRQVGLLQWRCSQVFQSPHVLLATTLDTWSPSARFLSNYSLLILGNLRSMAGCLCMIMLNVKLTKHLPFQLIRVPRFCTHSYGVVCMSGFSL